jgi:hypothetical protein
MWHGDMIDICKGVTTFFATVLSVPVKMGYKDERDDGVSFPTGVLTVVDYRQDPARRSGLTHIYMGDGSNGSVTRHKVPIPMNLYLQLDTVAFTRTDDHRMAMAAQSVLQQRHAKVTTPNGEELYLIPYQQDAIDSVVDSLWRKIYRFYVETWLEPYGEPETFPTLTTLRVVLNDVPLALPPPWCAQPAPRTLVATGVDPTVTIS